MMIKQFDNVQILKIKKNVKIENGKFDQVLPEVGDIATIVDIYTKPSIGYELESVDSNGQTRWLMAFNKDEIELVVVE